MKTNKVCKGPVEEAECDKCKDMIKKMRSMLTEWELEMKDIVQSIDGRTIIMLESELKMEEP